MSFRRIWPQLLLIVGFLLLTSISAAAQSLDQYGGYLDLPAPGGGTGFFRVEKVGPRWVFVTPAGNQFWYRGVQNIGDYFYPPSKYSTKAIWGRQVRRRLQAWGFSAIGPWAAVEVQSPTVTAPTVQMPFAPLFRPANNAIRNVNNYISEPVKDIPSNVPTSIYNGPRNILIDAYDPKYATYANARFPDGDNLGLIPGGATNPWVIGWVCDDGEEMLGVTKGQTLNNDVNAAHPSWLILVSKDPTDFTAAPGGFGPFTYGDLNNYSKQALRDFLRTRYGNNISALNAAWGSSYTSFDHAGGWGVGTGLMDEAGQHPWVASFRPAPLGDWSALNAMTAAAKTDLDDFLYNFVKKLADVMADAIRAADPNHLIFTPDSSTLWGYTARPKALQAWATRVDVIYGSYQEGPVDTAVRKLAPRDSYDASGKPLLMWVGMTANADSAMSAFGDPFGVDSSATQPGRGSKYSAYLTNLLNARGSNGDFPVVGLDWWGWEDQTNESANWGLVSLKDNAYDGKEAVMAPGTDPWGYLTGGEVQNYGDFLTSVTAANTQVYQLLSGQTPVSTTTSPTTASTGTTSSTSTSGTTTSSTTATVTVSLTPTVSIVFPINGDSVIRKSITSVIAIASADLGVSRVEFYINGSLKCSVPTAPYTCDWRVPAVPGRTYNLQTKIYDPLGHVGLSSIVSVTAK